MADFTHVNKDGTVGMVDTSQKKITLRSATAQAIVFLGKDIFELYKNNDISTKKGSITQTAIIAGTMAAKKTFDAIPFCHPLMLEKCSFTIEFLPQTFEVKILSTVKVEGKTGVEMEALHAVSVAALTIYDMCKAINQRMEIRSVKLLEKTGGKNDFKETL